MAGAFSLHWPDLSTGADPLPAWLATLPEASRRLCGLYCLLPRWSAKGWQQLTQRLDWHGADLPALSDLQQALARLSDRQRLALAGAWRRHTAQEWEAATRQLQQWLLEQAALDEAARLAAETGLAAQPLLQQHGWDLLFRPGRQWLPALLGTGSAGPTLLRAACCLELDKAAHKALPLLLRAETETGPSVDPPGALDCIRSALAWDVDDSANCLHLAQQALQQLPPGHVLHHFAHLSLARARISHGQLATAQASLLQLEVQTAPWHCLQLEVRQRLAWLASETGHADVDGRLQQLLQHSRHLSGSSLDSARRLRVWRQLQQLQLDEAQAGLLAGKPLWKFPHRVLLGLMHLLRNEHAAARQLADELQQQLEGSFQCQKWEVELLHLQLGLAARGGSADQQRLLNLILQRQQQPAGSWLYRQRLRLLELACRVLLQQPLDAHAWATHLQELQTAGALTLQRQLQRLLALQQQDLQWLAHDLAGPDRLDYLLLAPLTTALLPRIAVDAANAPVVHTLQHLLQPAAAGDASIPPSPARLPGLTARESEIMRLIASGCSNVQIATLLHISPSTLKTHINRVYQKLGLQSRRDVSRWLQQLPQLQD